MVAFRSLMGLAGGFLIPQEVITPQLVRRLARAGYYRLFGE